MIKNEYEIKKITINVQSKNYCPLGKDWYTNNFTIHITPNEFIPDYCDVDEFVKKQINNQQYIIEKAVSELHRYITETYKPLFCKIISSVNDATHSPVIVEK